MRVVSFVPSATETLLRLGARHLLVGVSDDCRRLGGLDDVPVVSTAAGHHLLDSAGIDAWVHGRQEEGESLYLLESETLAALRPDVVLTDDSCPVCAVPSSQVRAGLAAHAPLIVSLEVHDLASVLASFEQVGNVVGLPEAGRRLREATERRLHAIAAAPDGRRPEVLVLDWTDPLMAAGNWVPELVELAGGRPIIARSGERSRRLEDDDLPCRADAVVVAPCGLDVEASRAAAATLRRSGAVIAARWCALDGTAYFSRPGPGIVEGTTALSSWLAGRPLPGSVGCEVDP